MQSGKKKRQRLIYYYKNIFSPESAYNIAFSLPHFFILIHFKCINLNGYYLFFSFTHSLAPSLVALFCVLFPANLSMFRLLSGICLSTRLPIQLFGAQKTQNSHAHSRPIALRLKQKCRVRRERQMKRRREQKTVEKHSRNEYYVWALALYFISLRAACIYCTCDYIRSGRWRAKRDGAIKIKSNVKTCVCAANSYATAHLASGDAWIDRE